MYYDALFRTFPTLEGQEEITLHQLSPVMLPPSTKSSAIPKQHLFIPGSPRKTLAAVENIIGHYERDFRKRKTFVLGIHQKEVLVDLAGVFGVDRRVDMATIGCRMNTQHQGKGLATKAIALLLDYLFTIIEINRLQAFVMPVNEKSAAVLLRKWLSPGGANSPGTTLNRPRAGGSAAICQAWRRSHGLLTRNSRPSH